MTRGGAILLAALLSSSSAYAEESLLSQARRASASTAAQRAEPARGGIPSHYLWPGIGLVAAGVALVAIGIQDANSALCEDHINCPTAARVGGALAGSGVVLLVVGNAKRPTRSPDLAFAGGGVRVGRTVGF